MKYHVYSPDIIDDWTGWATSEDLFRQCLAAKDIDRWTDLAHEIGTAYISARDAGYDGIPRDAVVYVAVLPRPYHEGYGPSRWYFAFKQDNNGTTFIVTPYQMPWLGAAK